MWLEWGQGGMKAGLAGDTWWSTAIEESGVVVMFVRAAFLTVPTRYFRPRRPGMHSFIHLFIIRCDVATRSFSHRLGIAPPYTMTQ